MLLATKILICGDKGGKIVVKCALICDQLFMILQTTIIIFYILNIWWNESILAQFKGHLTNISACILMFKVWRKNKDQRWAYEPYRILVIAIDETDMYLYILQTLWHGRTFRSHYWHCAGNPPVHMVHFRHSFNLSPPRAAWMCQWIGSVLVRIMACRLLGTKPLSKPMLDYCQLDP